MKKKTCNSYYNSDVGIVIIEDDKLEAARQIIAELRGETD